MRLLYAGVLSLITVTAAAQTAAPWDTGSYVYDGSGNIKSIGTEQFRYDRLGRLVTGNAGAGRTQSATYDAYGNILTLTTDGTPLTFGVNPSTNRLTETNANIYGTYDPAGRVTAMTGGNTFTYDGSDTVMKSTVEGTTEVHLYSATDERIASVTISGGVETRSDWTVRDGGGRVLRRLEKNGGQWSWKEDYVYRGEQLLASEVDTPAQTLHFHTDHLGSPRLITGNGGMKISFHTYFPFGAEATSAAQDSETKKFTGHERDAASLDYMHARYYAPNWGRFVAVDPDHWYTKQGGTDEEQRTFQMNLRRPQAWNRYSYAYNNPLRYTDPDGKVVLVDDAAIGLVILGTIAVAATHTYLQSPNASDPSRTNAEVMGSQIQSALTGLMSPIIQAQNNRQTNKVVNGLIAAALTELGKVNSAGGPGKDPDFNHHKKEIKAMLDRALEVAKRLPKRAQEEVLRRVREIGRGVGLMY